MSIIYLVDTQNCKKGCISLSIHPSIHLSAYLFIHISIHLRDKVAEGDGEGVVPVRQSQSDFYLSSTADNQYEKIVHQDANKK